jgi:hypothetical protein
MTSSSPSAAVSPRARTRRVVLLAAILTSGAWALWPLSPATSSPEQDDSVLTPVGTPSAVPDRFDFVAYQTPLWVAPPPVPAPPPPPPATPPPPPLKLQLLAIIQTPDDKPDAGPTFSAMFYDPDAGKIMVLKEGDTVPGAGDGTASTGRSIAKVTARDVQIREPSINGRPAALSTISIPVPNVTLPKGGG